MYGVVGENLSRMKGWASRLENWGKNLPAAGTPDTKAQRRNGVKCVQGRPRGPVLLEWMAERPVKGDEVRKEVRGPWATVQTLHLLLSMMGSCRRAENSAVWLL